MTMQEVLAKIQKLRRLATSSNENEAALAAAKAAELITEYQVAEASLEVEIDESREQVEHITDLHERKATPWASIILNSVCKSVGCTLYYVGKEYRFIGRRSDVNAALYLYGLIKSDVERLARKGWESAKATSWESPRRWTNGFKRGAAMVVAGRLFDQRKAQAATVKADPTKTNALMVLNKRADAIQKIEATLNLRRGRSFSTRNVSMDGYSAGRAAGQIVNIGGRAKGGLPGAAARIA